MVVLGAQPTAMTAISGKEAAIAAYITFWKTLDSTRRVIRQPWGVRTNSSSYQSPQNST